MRKGVAEMSMAAARLSHNLIVDMYKKKPKINEKGDMVFKKSGLLLFCGLLLFIIFAACIPFMDYYVPEIIKENHMSLDMTGKLYLAGYGITGLFTLIGLRLIIIYFTHKIIMSNEEITAKVTFSTKSIKVAEIEEILFSNGKGLIFRDKYTKIVFGNFSIGLIEALKFIEKNVPKEKYEIAVNKAKKMLMNNKAIEFYTLE